MKKRKTGLTCPTCKSDSPNRLNYGQPKPGRCCSCDLMIESKKQKLQPDPYDEDVNGDASLHLQCEECRAESAADI